MLKRSIRRQKRSQPQPAEILEQRALLSSITVTTVADRIADEGTVTIREAIIAANNDQSIDGSEAGNGADEIVFAAGIDGPIVLTDGQLDLGARPVLA